MNCVERDEWETPKELFELLNDQYVFSFDCCANKINRKYYYYSNNFEGCNYKDLKMAWMNPPFSNALRMFKHFFKVVNRGVAIYRCDNMETKIWQEVILKNASWIFIPLGRISYEGMEGKGSRFPSALIGLNVPKPKCLKGTILKLE